MQKKSNLGWRAASWPNGELTRRSPNIQSHCSRGGTLHHLDSSLPYAASFCGLRDVTAPSQWWRCL